MDQLKSHQAILSLRPVWEKTPLADKIRDPNLDDPEDAAAFADLSSPDPFKQAMGELYFRVLWVACPDCKRSWNILTELGVCIACLDERQISEKRQMELGQYLRIAIGAYGIERYSFEAYQPDAGNLQAYVAMRDFDYRAHNIFVYGPPGTGKTHLSGAVLKKACAQGLTVAWLQPLYVGRQLRGKFPSEEEALIEEWVKKDIVIVDDLGVGRDLDVTLRMIYELIDKRQKQKRNGLILSSNEDLDRLSKAFKDVRIISRVKGMCKVISLIGMDKRLDSIR